MRETYRTMNDVIAHQLDQQVTLLVGREMRSMTKREAISTRAIEKAMRRDLKPLKNLLEIADRLGVHSDEEVLTWRVSKRQRAPAVMRYLRPPLTDTTTGSRVSPDCT